MSSAHYSRACDSCGDPLRPNRIYLGFIHTLDLHVCEVCAHSAAAGQYLLYQVAIARQIIKRHQRRLSSQVAS